MPNHIPVPWGQFWLPEEREFPGQFYWPQPIPGDLQSKASAAIPQEAEVLESLNATIGALVAGLADMSGRLRLSESSSSRTLHRNRLPTKLPDRGTNLFIGLVKWNAAMILSIQARFNQRDLDMCQ